ncbi:MAG: AtpZ/AtpI family protein [Polyangiaceae bacterium]|nr:AtpZ/AtpI family protein [Polyangiaceae bacterium]
MAALRYPWKASSTYGALGLEVVISILLGLGGGLWLDGKLGTEPGFTFAGLVFGIAAAVRYIYRAAKRMEKETRDDGFRSTDADRPSVLSVRERLTRLADADRLPAPPDGEASATDGSRAAARPPRRARGAAAQRTKRPKAKEPEHGDDDR